MKFLGNSDEVNQNLRTLFRCWPTQYLLHSPEADVIKPPCERHHIRRYNKLVLFVPAAADELVGLNASEGRQVQERQLAREVLGGDAEGVQDRLVVPAHRGAGGVARQALGLAVRRDAAPGGQGPVVVVAGPPAVRGRLQRPLHVSGRRRPGHGLPVQVPGGQLAGRGRAVLDRVAPRLQCLQPVGGPVRGAVGARAAVQVVVVVLLVVMVVRGLGLAVLADGRLVLEEAAPRAAPAVVRDAQGGEAVAGHVAGHLRVPHLGHGLRGGGSGSGGGG